MRTTHAIPTSRFAPAVALAMAFVAAPTLRAQDTTRHGGKVPGSTPTSIDPRVPTRTTPTTTTPTTTNPTAATTASRDIEDTSFVRELRTNNLLEIRMGSVAARRSTNPAVKQFAQRMVTDHTTMGNEWTSLASRLGLGTTSALDVNQQQVVSQLSSVPAAQFDQQYMSDAVQMHQNVIGLLQSRGASAQNVDVRQLAAKGLPIIEQHLTMAQQVASQIGASVATTSPGTISIAGPAWLRRTTSRCRTTSGTCIRTRWIGSRRHPARTSTGCTSTS
jgi:putative membrane protein